MSGHFFRCDTTQNPWGWDFSSVCRDCSGCSNVQGICLSKYSHSPLHPHHLMMLSWPQDCFSMANISWYGGASIHAQRWPLNGAESLAQPFVSGDLSKNPTGYGPVLERYFLGSTGNHSLPCLCSFNLCVSPSFSSPMRQLISEQGGSL